jgi:hypothetical protein
MILTFFFILDSVFLLGGHNPFSNTQHLGKKLILEI